MDLEYIIAQLDEEKRRLESAVSHLQHLLEIRDLTAKGNNRTYADASRLLRLVKKNYRTDKKPKPPDSRIAEMKAMREAGHHLAEIGEAFHLSRERVRQLIGNTGYIPGPPKPPKWPRAYFERVMKQWLWDAGIRKCTTCKTWVAEGLTRANRLCHSCGRQRTKQYYRDEAYRRKQEEWRLANPDKLREYWRRYKRRKRAHSIEAGSPAEPPT